MALAISAPSKPAPKTQSRHCFATRGHAAPHRALVSLWLPGTCSARSLWDIANPAGAGFKQNVPLPDVPCNLPQCTGPYTGHRRHKSLQKPSGECPSPCAGRSVGITRAGRVTGKEQWSFIQLFSTQISHLHPALGWLAVNRLGIVSSWVMLCRGRAIGNATQALNLSSD